MSQHQSLATTETDPDLRDVEIELGGGEAKQKDETKQQSLRFNAGGSNQQSTLVWKEIVKFVDDGTEEKKQILFGVSGVAKPGEMIALMGPSGSGEQVKFNLAASLLFSIFMGGVFVLCTDVFISHTGKTTLLNVLGGRGRANMKGLVTINGRAFSKTMRKQIAYVLQEDIFYTQLTVRQQLTITSHLRLPDSLTHEEKAAAVDHVIKTLRIKKCENTQILLISGGEKKRCNIGTELLTNPSILLLGEKNVIIAGENL